LDNQKLLTSECQTSSLDLATFNNDVVENTKKRKLPS
jgi:hypothetical protein